MEQTIDTGLKRIGKLKLDNDVLANSQCWMLGCETLDRDFADFQEYKQYIPALGIRLLRLQSGWAKTEKVKGTYDFSWLDKIVDDATALGLKCLLETDYGNPAYPGGGGPDLSGSFPTSTEALDAWDVWVEHLVLHFQDRVNDWAMWNEPDNAIAVTPDAIADFNIRTAKIIRRLQPSARILGLSLGRSDTSYYMECLNAIREKGGEELFDAYIYHGYKYNPDEASDAGMHILRAMRRNGFLAELVQGENGCPSEETQKFALRKYPWTEFSQSKWDLRRFMGDYFAGVTSSVFTICDFNHIGRQINRKGLLLADENHKVLRPKMAYGAIANMTTLLNDKLVPREGAGAIRYNHQTQFHAFTKDDRKLLAYWDSSSTPSNDTSCGKADILLRDFAISNPVLIDAISGHAYEIPEDNIKTLGNISILTDIPCTDSPFVIAEQQCYTITDK